MTAEGHSDRTASGMEVWMEQRCVTEFLDETKMAPTDIHHCSLYISGAGDVSKMRQWVVLFSIDESDVKDMHVSDGLSQLSSVVISTEKKEEALVSEQCAYLKFHAYFSCLVFKDTVTSSVRTFYSYLQKTSGNAFLCIFCSLWS